MQQRALIATALMRAERGVYPHAGAAFPVMSVHAAGRISQTLRLDGRAQRRWLAPGVIDILPAQAECVFEDDGPNAVLALAIPDVAVEQACDELGLRLRRLPPLFGARDHELARLSWALHRAGDEDLLYRQCASDELARRLVRLAEPSALDREPKVRALDRARLRRVLDFIDHNLDQPFTVEDLAAQAGLGLTVFKAAFRATFGDAAHRYVVRRRCQQARLMLLEGVLPASQVALAAGFSHQSHMARWLRRLFGALPSELAQARSRPASG